jgi:hypothetical protein
MKLSIKIIDIFFRRMSIEKVFQDFNKEHFPLTTDANMQRFLLLADTTLEGYSADEHQNIFHYYTQQYDGASLRKDKPPFHLLTEFASEVLEWDGGVPICRHHHAIHWRTASLLLGQDLFTTAWMAEQVTLGKKPSYFSWPITLPVNNPLLNRTLVDLAENHLHLYAGASTFSLTWACLMNHPRSILPTSDLSKSFDTTLQMYSIRDSKDCLWPVSRKVLYAAYIRAALFCEIHNESKEASEKFLRFHNGYITDEYSCMDVTVLIDSIRLLHGLKFSQPGTTDAACLDYAFTSELSNEVDKSLRVLAGERKFMYTCFRKCFSGEFSLLSQWLFYVYLLLKSQCRSELIQVNGQTGFSNFSAYDKRKYLIWRKMPEYWNEDYRQAINASFEEQKITSLEGRLSPQKTAIENIKLIHSIDRAKLFCDAKLPIEKCKVNLWKPSYYMENQAKDEPYFFVFHFAKKKDIPLSNSKFVPCRHEALRRDVRWRAIQLAKSLSNSDYLCQRIRGIDACSNEISCRPEVFSVAFRFLRSFPAENYRTLTYNREIPRLSVTYHVGEDFLDIASGLRAVDEAIHFLDLRPSDRLGHALALGVDPMLHYEYKHQQIILTKQELLDNLVWIYYRSLELNVEIHPQLRETLHEKANSLFYDIYFAEIADKASNLEDYYHSMLLRGDSPVCYKSGELFEPVPLDFFDTYQLNQRTDIAGILRNYRRNTRMTNLYCLYHYSYNVRIESKKLVKWEITNDYILLIGKLQIAMQKFVDKQGISIECNPSSNVLIGTFSQYTNHPIFNFNRNGLHLPTKDVQMHVSINSDDPGVFDTTLTFEYALIAQALEEMKDKDGNPLHTEREIEDYLRALVRMGREQCFPGTQS